MIIMRVVLLYSFHHLNLIHQSAPTPSPYEFSHTTRLYDPPLPTLRPHVPLITHFATSRLSALIHELHHNSQTS